MEKLLKYDDFNYAAVEIDKEWNDSSDEEKLMHRLHAYPAKFPAFIASKAFEYAEKENITINKVADIFCGCGTVALESKLHKHEFWGCDLNPVAVLIAKAKSSFYDIDAINEYYNNVLGLIGKKNIESEEYNRANERLKYWYDRDSYLELLKIKRAIDDGVEDDYYRDAFYCIFSSMLKSASKWLTKSIKPQVDPDKKRIDVLKKFKLQYEKYCRALKQIENIAEVNIEVECANFLTLEGVPKVDLVITSPPYVTSYEYADLHQLSTLWLGYADDFRELRDGTIGSIYGCENYNLGEDRLNNTGREIIENLTNNKCAKSKINSVARYYIDMQMAINKCYKMLNVGGMAFFVIGDTEYKGVKILNAKHLVEAMQEIGFIDIKIGKRVISKGICTPYRDDDGKFTTKDKSRRKVYHEEYIISGKKLDYEAKL